MLNTCLIRRVGQHITGHIVLSSIRSLSEFTVEVRKLKEDLTFCEVQQTVRWADEFSSTVNAFTVN